MDAQIKAATVRLLAEDFQGARTYTEAALKVQPKEVQAQVILATALAGLKEVSAALRQLEEAIQIAPGTTGPTRASAPFTSARGIKSSRKTPSEGRSTLNPKP